MTGKAGQLTGKSGHLTGKAGHLTEKSGKVIRILSIYIFGLIEPKNDSEIYRIAGCVTIKSGYILVFLVQPNLGLTEPSVEPDNLTADLVKTY